MKSYQKKMLASSLILLMCTQNCYNSTNAFLGFGISCRGSLGEEWELTQKYRTLKQHFAVEKNSIQNTNDCFNKFKEDFLNRDNKKKYPSILGSPSETIINQKIERLMRDLTGKMRTLQNSIDRLKEDAKECTSAEVDADISRLESEVIELQNLNEDSIIKFNAFKSKLLYYSATERNCTRNMENLFDLSYQSGDSDWYKKNEYLLVVNRGWKIHISPNTDHCKEVFEIVDALSDEIGFTFKVNKHMDLYAQSFLLYEANDSQRGKYITIYPNSDEIAAEISERLNEEFQKRGLTDEDFMELRYDFKIYPGIYTRFTSYDDSDGETRGRLDVPELTLLRFYIDKAKRTEDIPVDAIKETAELKKKTDKIFSELKNLLKREKIRTDIYGLINDYGKPDETVARGPFSREVSKYRWPAIDGSQFKDRIYQMVTEIQKSRREWWDSPSYEKVSNYKEENVRYEDEEWYNVEVDKKIQDLVNKYQHPFKQLSVANITMSKSVAEINEYLSDPSNRETISGYFKDQSERFHDKFCPCTF